MRVLDKILYKAKLQVGGKVIKTDKGYVENPDGILNSATIDANKYTGIDKAKIISDKFNGQDVKSYNYKGVDYLLDYKPKGLDNIDYGISDKTYTKPVTPVTTTNTNSTPTTISERSSPKFMPNAHFSTDMSKSTNTSTTNTPPVSSTSTKTNGLNKGLYTAAEKADKSGITLKPTPIISSVIGNTTSQQSTNNTAIQQASTTTTEPQKRRGFFNRIFGRKDNKVISDNPTSSTDTKSATTSANNISLPTLNTNTPTKDIGLSMPKSQNNSSNSDIGTSTSKSDDKKYKGIGLTETEKETPKQVTTDKPVTKTVSKTNDTPIKEYQERIGVPVTGVLDEETISTFETLVTEGMKSNDQKVKNYTLDTFYKNAPKELIDKATNISYLSYAPMLGLDKQSKEAFAKDFAYSYTRTSNPPAIYKEVLKKFPYLQQYINAEKSKSTNSYAYGGYSRRFI